MANDPKSRLDRIARDLSRTWLHGSRVTDSTGHVRPATVATAQQIQVDLPDSGPMNFEFTSSASTARVIVTRPQAINSQTFMTKAVGDDKAKYLTLNADDTIPTWVFSQRSYSMPVPVPDEDKISITLPAGNLDLVKLPSAALGEVEDTADNFVSLQQFDSAKKEWKAIPASSWQPAIMLRFKLKQPPPTPEIPAGMRIFEIHGTPQGDRYFLDHLGLLDAFLSSQSDPNPPEIEAISLALQPSAKDAPSQINDWTIIRTNLTREARSGSGFAPAAAPATLPYVAISDGSADQNLDAVRLLQMISITNSGGYFLRTTTTMANPDSLVLNITLKAKPEPKNGGGTLLPRAANALALVPGTIADSIRFHGLDHIQIIPAVPPGNVAFGWTRTETVTTGSEDEDKFGYGTISLVDYTAVDGTGTQVGTYSADTVIAISPTQPLPGELYDRHSDTATDDTSGHHLHTGKASAMRLLAPHEVRAKSIASFAAGDAVVRYFRSTLECYNQKAQTESPYARIADPLRSQITLTPGFRDVFGNRFTAAAAPPVRRRLFYTDALVNPSEWPGIRFAVYPGLQGGKPYIYLEMQYRYLKYGEDKTARLQGLELVRTQLQGAKADVGVSYTVDPFVGGPIKLSVATLVNQITTWIAKEKANTGLQEPPCDPFSLDARQCSGVVTDVVQFQPRLTIARTKPDYLPTATELPSDASLSKSIQRQISSASSLIMLQAATAAIPIGAPIRKDEDFRDIARAFQNILAAPTKTQVGFLRDRLNLHQLWFVPQSFFPTTPSPATTYSKWSFATARPLSNKLGSETFNVPDFSAGCTTTGPDCWNKHPVVPLTVTDQDFDGLGRTAFRLIEQESIGLAVMTAKANATAARLLLAEREQIALTLSSFRGDGGPGYLVPLYKTPGDLDPANVTRIARDAFLANLAAFYDVDTILQLPLKTPGSDKILIFEGSVTTTFVADSTAPPPILSNVLLAGGAGKVTLLYDLPPGTIDASNVPKLDVVTARLHHVQLPLNDNPPSAQNNLFNQGRWLELVQPQDIQWKGPGNYIPVADRRFPAKPFITSTRAIAPAPSLVAPVTWQNAGLLARWGWLFNFGLVDPGANDLVHVTVRYNEANDVQVGFAPADVTSTWAPQSLLNSLFAFKLLQDNLAGIPEPDRLQIVAELAAFLHGMLSPPATFAAFDAGRPEDHFTIAAPTAGGPPPTAPGPDTGGLAVMQGPIRLTWTTPVSKPPTVDVLATAEAAKNNAFLTGPNQVRNYRVALRLLRNEYLGPSTSDYAADPSLIYECAPVESALACWAQNMWSGLEYQMTAGESLDTALRHFFEGLLLKASLSRMKIEISAALTWKSGKLEGVTPFSILPADINPGTGSQPKDYASFVYDKLYKDLLGTNVPPDVQPGLRLRVKLATDDPGPASRTLLEITSIDFKLT